MKCIFHSNNLQWKDICIEKTYELRLSSDIRKMTMWQNNKDRYIFSGSGEKYCNTQRCACTKWKPKDTIMCCINKGCPTVPTEKKGRINTLRIT